MSNEPQGTFDSIREAWVMKKFNFKRERVSLSFREAEWIDTCLRLATERPSTPVAAQGQTTKDLMRLRAIANEISDEGHTGWGNEIRQIVARGLAGEAASQPTTDKK